MNKSIVCFVACLLGLVACNVEHYDHAVPGDCKDDPFGDGNDFGGTHSGYAGAKASGGHSAGTGGSTSTAAGAGSGATAATAGSSDTGASGSAQNSGEADGGAGAPATAVGPTPCDKESDCAPGYNCDLDQHQCLPADQETCGELDTELACTNRKDCTPVYGGVNCSCGTNCECHGGEPGCVCESFQFFVCQDAP